MCLCIIITKNFQIIPVPKPRGLYLNEQDLHTAERINRRSERKKNEEEKKIQERKIILEQSKNKNFLKKIKSNTSLSTINEKDNQNLIKKTTFFGEEILPDFNIGKRIESQVTDEYCIWDEPINYELQVGSDVEVVESNMYVVLNQSINHLVCYTMLCKVNESSFMIDMN